MIPRTGPPQPGAAQADSAPQRDRPRQWHDRKYVSQAPRPSTRIFNTRIDGRITRSEYLGRYAGEVFRTGRPLSAPARSGSRHLADSRKRRILFCVRIDAACRRPAGLFPFGWFKTGKSALISARHRDRRRRALPQRDPTFSQDCRRDSSSVTGLQLRFPVRGQSRNCPLDQTKRQWQLVGTSRSSSQP